MWGDCLKLALQLCLADCLRAEHKSLNLVPIPFDTFHHNTAPPTLSSFDFVNLSKAYPSMIYVASQLPIILWFISKLQVLLTRLSIMPLDLLSNWLDIGLSLAFCYVGALVKICEVLIWLSYLVFWIGHLQSILQSLGQVSRSILSQDLHLPVVLLLNYGISSHLDLAMPPNIWYAKWPRYVYIHQSNVLRKFSR